MEDFVKHLKEEYTHTHLDLIEKEPTEFDKKGRPTSKYKRYIFVKDLSINLYWIIRDIWVSLERKGGLVIRSIEGVSEFWWTERSHLLDGPGKFIDSN